MIRIVHWPRFLIFVLLLVGVFFAGWWVFGSSVSALEKGGVFEIEEGMGARSVWEKLVDEGYTSSELVWRVSAWRQDASVSLQAGSYELVAGEQVSEVVARFAAGEVVADERSVTFPEGFTAQQMAVRLEGREIVDAEAFLAAAKPERTASLFALVREIPAGRNLEGYLFPDTYHISVDDTADDIVAKMVGTFERRFSEDMRVATQQSGRSIDEIVIMASIIEREVISEADMALVSGVLWKRLDEGIGLGADATVRYALEKWDSPLTVQDLAIDSPYNTRKFRGLPPGPISNPGLRALRAAVFPEESEFYYYLSSPDGETIFSRTLDEHNVNKAKYLN